ncbi:hypothetical protein FA95DRAFT_158444 [Auriscalpium vulgare]|uniref:Uncharacterized protein n=1 Tax=Auriscalpium vulgare TaxID=40419 RepID=A0ACB8RNX3_9AGAM|nr:hypothetical protein FA95DRAFT_158444 [Auriscalpium vulgare]
MFLGDRRLGMAHRGESRYGSSTTSSRFCMLQRSISSTAPRYILVMQSQTYILFAILTPWIRHSLVYPPSPHFYLPMILAPAMPQNSQLELVAYCPDKRFLDKYVRQTLGSCPVKQERRLLSMR